VTIEYVFIGAVTSVALTWAGWVSISIIQHGKQMQGLINSVLVHNESIKEIQKTAVETTKIITKIDRNVVRIGMSLKINDELEK